MRKAVQRTVKRMAGRLCERGRCARRAGLWMGLTWMAVVLEDGAR